MSQFSKCVYCPQTPEKVFEVVQDIESYPEFVPACHEAKIISQDTDCTVAALTFRVGMKSLRFTTRNTAVPHQSINMTLVDGPFRTLEGSWRFTAQGQGTEVKCVIDYEFSSKKMTLLFSLIFPRIMDFLISSFISRTQHQADS